MRDSRGISSSVSFENSMFWRRAEVDSSIPSIGDVGSINVKEKDDPSSAGWEMLHCPTILLAFSCNRKNQSSEYKSERARTYKLYGDGDCVICYEHGEDVCLDK